MKGVGSHSSPEGSVKAWSCSEDSPVRFGLICQFAVILLPQLCRVTTRIASESSWESLTRRVYARPRSWFTSGQSLPNQTECLSSTRNTSYKDLNSNDNLQKVLSSQSNGAVKIGLIYFKLFSIRGAGKLLICTTKNFTVLHLNIVYKYIKSDCTALHAHLHNVISCTCR